jgi:hypothetical protein
MLGVSNGLATVVTFRGWTGTCAGGGSGSASLRALGRAVGAWVVGMRLPEGGAYGPW